MEKKKPNKGIALIVDLDKFPNELCDKYNDLPLAPESISPYKLGKLHGRNDKRLSKIPKLICHFHKKHNYTVYYKNLEYYLDQGMKITKIHKIMEFTEKPIIKVISNLILIKERRQ